MSPSRRTRASTARTLTCAALACSAALTGCVRTLNIPRPTPGSQAAPPALPASQVQVPVTVDVRSALAQMESEVPREFDTGGRYEAVMSSPLAIRYHVRRSPFIFTPHNGALRGEATLAVSVEACVRAPLGELIGLNHCQPVASCGLNGEPPRQVVIAVNTALTLDSQWQIRSQTTAEPPSFRDRCLVTAVRFDVTDLVANLVSERVTQAARRADENLASRGNLRPMARTIWQGLREPVELGEGFWLSINPEAVTASALQIDPNSLRTTVGVSARPHVSSGSRPTVPARELPSLGSGAGEPGLRLTLDAQVSFAEATRMLANHFRGQTMEIRGQSVLVRDIRVEGRGGALVFAMDIRFSSGPFTNTEGTVFLAGLPHYDERTGELTVRNIDYTIETQNVLLRIGDWLHQSELREALGRRARWPLGAQIERLRTRAAGALDRPLGSGATMHGTISSVRAQGAYVTEQGIVVRVVADGSAEIRQDVSSILGGAQGPAPH